MSAPAQSQHRLHGFTLVELLVAMLILSLLALMSYRGLGAVLDARDHVRLESEKWRRVANFFERFGADVSLAAPRSARAGGGTVPAWSGQQLGASLQAQLEFSRFASVEGMDMARRLAYRLNDRQQIELWVWPGIDVAPAVQPARVPLLAGVTGFDLQYLNAELAWVNQWPAGNSGSPIPRAVRVRIVLVSGEELVRVFALQS